MWRLAPDADPWSQTDYFLAWLIEEIDTLNRQTMLLRGVKPHQLPKGLHITRPGEAEQRKKVETDPKAILGFFSKHMRG